MNFNLCFIVSYDPFLCALSHQYCWPKGKEANTRLIDSMTDHCIDVTNPGGSDSQGAVSPVVTAHHGAVSRPGLVPGI